MRLIFLSLLLFLTACETTSQFTDEYYVYEEIYKDEPRLLGRTWWVELDDFISYVGKMEGVHFRKNENIDSQLLLITTEKLRKENSIEFLKNALWIYGHYLEETPEGDFKIHSRASRWHLDRDVVKPVNEEQSSGKYGVRELVLNREKASAAYAYLRPIAGQKGGMSFDGERNSIAILSYDYNISEIKSLVSALDKEPSFKTIEIKLKNTCSKDYLIKPEAKSEVTLAWWENALVKESNEENVIIVQGYPFDADKKAKSIVGLDKAGAIKGNRNCST